jgi:enoyl-CoA hydratase
MAPELLQIERRDDVVVVRLHRPAQGNTLSRALLGELLEIARELADDTKTAAVVLTGTADLFSMGADLKDPASADVANAALVERRKLLELGPKVCRAWQEIDALTVAAIEGWCIGGGYAIAIACDLRVAGESARLWVPEVKLGLNMSWGSVPRTVNLVGPARAKRLIALAERHDARRLCDWGIVDEVVPDGQALERALEFAASAVALPPVSLRMAKRGIDRCASALNEATSFMDADQFALATTSEDYREAMRAFLEKRDPRFTGR